MKKKKNIFIATFGCQMNDYDSKRILQLLDDDYARIDRPDLADLIIINTCSIREKAEHKLYSLAGRYKPLKRRNPALVIGIGGCVAQQEGRRLLKRMDYVDMVFGPQGLYRLPEMIKEAEEGRRSVFTELSPDFRIPAIVAPLPEKNPVRAFVTIMQGCNNFCSYCVVPNVRGREISRPPEEIVREVEDAVRQGVREITLLGQNVNSYGRHDSRYPSFPELLDMVDAVRGLARLRFTTSHPKDLSDELIDRFGQLDSLCEHLHLPVQSGSTRILRQMNRRYSREDYLAKITRLREKCPEITLTTDIIAGFPGETESDFMETISLLERVRYDQIFAFKYSKRPGTRAVELDGHLPEEVKAARLAAILELQTEIGLSQYGKLEDRIEEVLVEEVADKNDRENVWLRGRTRGNHVVNFRGPAALRGMFVNVLVEKACNHSLSGRYLNVNEQDNVTNLSESGATSC